MPGEAILPIAVPSGTFANIRVAYRRVLQGDEELLLPEEQRSFVSCAQLVRRQGGSARVVARSLLQDLGFADWPLLRRFARGPVWPPAVRGSMAHSADWAIAAVTSCDAYLGVGVDIEPIQPLPHELFQYVATTDERRHIKPDTTEATALFCAKEATYKAVHPLDGKFLEMSDICVDFSSGCSTTNYGRRVDLFVHVDEAIVVLGALRRTGTGSGNS